MEATVEERVQSKRTGDPSASRRHQRSKCLSRAFAARQDRKKNIEERVDCIPSSKGAQGVPTRHWQRLILEDIVEGILCAGIGDLFCRLARWRAFFQWMDVA